MKKLIDHAIAGVIAIALMAMAKLLLSQQAGLIAEWHYPAFSLQGQEGLRKLALFAIWGAGYAVAWSLLLKSLLPGGPIFGPLALGAIPTLVAALVLPLYYGGTALKEPWTLFWLYAHWTIWALCFLFIAGGKSAGGKRSSADD